jgi:hypothetical protein
MTDRDLERRPAELPGEILPRQLDAVAERPVQSRAHVAGDQREGLGIPDRQAVPGEERPDQLLAGLCDLGQDVVAPGELLDHPVLKAEDALTLIPDALASRDDRGQGRVDPLEHRRRNLGPQRLRLRAGGLPGRAQRLHLTQISVELRRPAGESVIRRGELGAHDHPGVVQVGQGTRRGGRVERLRRGSQPTTDPLAGRREPAVRGRARALPRSALCRKEWPPPRHVRDLGDWNWRGCRLRCRAACVAGWMPDGAPHATNERRRADNSDRARTRHVTTMQPQVPVAESCSHASCARGELDHRRRPKSDEEGAPGKYRLVNHHCAATWTTTLGDLIAAL